MIFMATALIFRDHFRFDLNFKKPVKGIETSIRNKECAM